MQDGSWSIYAMDHGITIAKSTARLIHKHKIQQSEYDYIHVCITEIII